MRTAIAAFLVALLFTAFPPPPVQAAPTEVNVRIEGRSETLFEGPILAEPHEVQALSDEQPRRCDGINALDPWNEFPAPTPTSTSVDAMNIIGEPFNGKWYPGFEDYFITRWGPDREEEGMSWGLLVNNVFTSVGGCQYQLDHGDEVLWVYNAFNHRPLLALFPQGYSSGTRPLTATAELGVPFTVEVVSYGDDAEDVPPPSPGRAGSTPFEGAEVAPVQTSGKGFEKVDVTSPETVTTDAEGKATVTFAQPGWHRIKATVAGAPGDEQAIRSNRLDVCVPEAGAGGCEEPWPEDEVRIPPVAEKPKADEGAPGQQGLPPGGDTGAPPLSKPAERRGSRVRISTPQLNRSNIARGRVGVSWRVLSAGVGIEGWRISSQTLGRRGARYVSRATGAGKTSALLRLPLGQTYRLRLTVTDLLARSSTATIGDVVVPDGDRR
jgi:hypothetical protein